ncbi:MAG: multi-sensor signal transduction histidine kinase [Thermoleophilia bacterium]|nr:multi-sensor signal transduction histidine kinase [Thermoleophilia bacterium]
MSDPLFDAIVEAMSRASIGDLSARVQVPREPETVPESEEQLRTIGEMLNVLLGDLDYRVSQSRESFREDLEASEDREGAVLQRHGQLERIIEAAGEAIWVLDAAGRTILVNSATELMTGRSRSELQSIEPDQLVHGADGATSPIRETVVFGASRRVVDATLARRDGAMLAVTYTSHPIYDAAGAQVGSVLVLRDMSAEREAEERKAQFFTMASHELRTPLTAIKGFADTLVHRWDAFDDESRLGFLQIIDDQSDRLVRLVNDVLTLARLEQGALEVDPASVPVRDVLERVRVLTDRGFEIQCSNELRTFCDEDHLEQIVLNFASNALKYGQPPYCMSAVADDDGSVRIAVVDHGSGVPPEFRARLFDRFTQAERRPEGAGTGLGLSIAERLAKAQGGRAWHEPVEPNGARFVVRLPPARS